MLMKGLEALRIVNNGKLDTMRLLMYGVPLLLFLAWRIAGTGVSDSERITRLLKEEIINDYKEGLYKEYGFYEKDIVDNPKAKDFPSEELLYLDVSISNVSFSAPLFSFSATEQVGIRFDYRLTRDGLVKQQDKEVYMLVHRKGGVSFWPSGAFTYYLQYF